MWSFTHIGLQLIKYDAFVLIISIITFVIYKVVDITLLFEADDNYMYIDLSNQLQFHREVTTEFNTTISPRSYYSIKCLIRPFWGAVML